MGASNLALVSFSTQDQLSNNSKEIIIIIKTGVSYFYKTDEVRVVLTEQRIFDRRTFDPTSIVQRRATTPNHLVIRVKEFLLF
jgi:hypothetical protein